VVIFETGDLMLFQVGFNFKDLVCFIYNVDFVEFFIEYFIFLLMNIKARRVVIQRWLLDRFLSQSVSKAYRTCWRSEFLDRLFEFVYRFTL
jgi:hypothetical protein